MPTYSISGPDGRIYSIDGPEGATREQVISAIQARLAEQPVETVAPAPIQPKESTIGGEFRRGISSLLSGARTGAGAIFGSPEEAAVAGLERSREISEAAGEGPSLSRIGRIYEERGLLPAAGQVASDVPKLLAQQAPQIGTALVGSRLGAMAGSAFGPPGMLVGGALGAAAALAPSIFGQSIERQAQEQIEAGQPVDISTGRAAAATAGSVALEATGLGLTLGKTAVKSLLGVTDDAALLAAKNQQRLAQAAEATLLGTAARGVGRGVVVEMPVEVAQSVLERWQAGLDVTSPDALQEYGEAMYAAGLVGGPLGAVGSIQARREAQQLTLAPGQEPGESLYDTATRLNTQIQALDQLIKQADVEATKSQIGIMSGTDLIDMYRTQGYGAVKQYQVSLEEKAQDTELSKEQRQEAAKAAKDVGSLLEQVTAEETARKFFATPNIINNRDVDNLGFSRDDPVRAKILNKDINNPDQAAEILSVLEAEKKGADPVRLETINTALETINGYLGSSFYGAIQQPSREGIPVAGVPGGRPAAIRPPTLEPTGVVRPETDVGGVVRREAVEPAPVAPVTAPQSLAQVGDAGTAIVANMYQAMLDAHQQGKTVVGGIPDPVLIAAARDGRQFKTIDEIKVYAQQPSVLNRSKNIARGIQIQNMMRAGQTLPDIQKKFPKIDVPKVLEKLQQELTPKKLSITPELEARAGEILKAQEAEAKEAKEVAPEVTPKTEKEAQIAQRQVLITQLDGVLKRILAKYGLKDVKLNLQEAFQDEGSYQRQIITLALNVDNPVRVLRHESIHALKDMGFFSDAQWKTLTKRANDEWIGVLKATPHSETQSRYDAYIDLFTQEGKAKGLSGEGLTSYVNEAVIEEAIADAFGGYDATKAPPGLMSAILNRMRNLFKAIKEAFNLSGIETAEEIFGKIEKGKLKPAVPAAKEVKPTEVTPTETKPKEEKPEEAKPSLRPSEENAWQATPKEREQEVVALAKTGQVKASLRNIQTDSANFKKWSNNAPIIIDTTDYQGGPAVFKAFHGTTYNDITVFDTAMGSKEGSLGAGPYLSTSVDDVNANYAGVGPDLTIKISRAEEKIGEDFTFDDYSASNILSDYFSDNDLNIEVTDDNFNNLKDQYADAAVQHAAVKQLKGKSEGVVVPAYVRLLKPFDMRGNQGTRFTIEFKYDAEGDPIGEPTGSGMDLIKAIGVVADSYNADASDLQNYVFENQEVTAKEVFDRAAKAVPNLYDDDGELVSSGQFIQDVAKEMGFDGLIQDADYYFGAGRTGAFGIKQKGMEGVYKNTLHIMPFSSEQIKSSVGNIGTFGQEKITEEQAARLGMTEKQAAEAQKRGDIRFSLRSPIGLYSELENKIEAVSSKAAPAAQWKAMINAMPQKGVKPEEIEWSGVNDWLDLQEGKVNKEDLLKYLKKNGVQVEEVVLSAAMAYPVNVEEITEYFDEPATPNGDPARKIYRLSFLERGKEEPTAFTAYDVVGRGTELYEPWGEFIDEYTSIRAAKEYVVGVAEFNQSISSGVTPFATQAEDGPRYDSYVLPNGENYREVLLTLPIKLDAKTKRLLDEERLLVLTPEQQTKVDAAKKKAGIQFVSSHWEQPNVLAHIRLNDRVDADGNKVLFVEEIQSDWGQEGKKRGFADTSVSMSELRKQYDALNAERRKVEKVVAEGDDADPATQAAVDRSSEINRQMNLLSDRMTALRSGIPTAPFVTKTEGWLNLALKRIMIMAAEGDYDKVAFVNGAQSADRYNLSKQVDYIDYVKEGLDKYRIAVVGTNGQGIDLPKETFSSAELENYVGKEIAQKIVNGEGDFGGGRTTLRGADLKVGGEGMKAFYDTIVPTAVKKLLPKVGGKQLETVNIATEEDRATMPLSGDDVMEELGIPENQRRAYWANLTDKKRDQLMSEYRKREAPRSPQPGFDVTPEMKEKIAATGLPKFSLRSLVSNAMTPQVTATVNKIAPPRYDPTLWERILNAVSGDSFTKLRSQIINRYEILAKYDRRVAEMIRQSGGVQQLADQKAESAALFSDLTSGLLASALGANDKFGGAPVFRNGITVISNQNGTVKGPVLIFKPLADLKSPEVFRLWQTYVAVKRGVRLDALGKEHLIDQADVKAMKTMAQSNPQLIALFESVRKDWIKYNDALVKYMQDTGVITPKMAQEWTRHGDYFPFYRLAEEDVVGPRGFRSIANVTPPKALKGGENPLGDFFENVVRNSQAAIQAGIKNVAAQRATEQGLKLKEVVRLPRKRSGVNVYRVLENGQEVYYESADPLFIDAIKSLNMPDLPFLGLLAGPANLLRNLVTKDPAFMLANMMRDSLSAYTTSGVKMTPFVDTIKNFGKAIANRSPETRDLYAAGVLGGYDYSKGVKTSAREFEQRLREVSGTKTPTEKLLTPITSLWGALEKGTQASDAATRAEVYKRVLAETGNEAEAYWQALEVMNFNRRGNSPVVRVLTAAIPFLNARMQGLDLLYRTAIFPLGGTASEAAKQRMKTFWVRGMTLMSLSMMYWALTHDDEEYKKQEQETRDNYWLFPSLGIKIPIPFEVGVMFKVIPERLAALTLGDDTYKDFTKSMVRQLTSTFGINLIPQAALPIAEVTTNYSFFTGRSIIGKGLEDVAPQYQISPGTSRVAEMIGQSLGMSPIKLDHLLKGYTGSLGMYASDLFDMVFDMNSDAPKASKRFEQMPIIKRFAVDPEARGTVTAYYELKDSVDEVVRTSNLLERSMNYKDYGQYMTDNIRMLATKDYINALERNMKEFREMKLAIRTSAMSAEAKRDALTSIGRMESQLTQNIQTLKKNAQ